ncbi:MAG: winged helix-turn-helix domain-containing protein [Candidatus Nezhaarchaeales archaeon]
MERLNYSERKMSKSPDVLTPKLIELLEKDPGQTVKQLAEQLSVNRTFLAGYLKALESQGYVRSKKIGPAKVYFKGHGKSDKNEKYGFFPTLNVFRLP